MNGQIFLVRVSDYHKGLASPPQEINEAGLMTVRFEIDGRLYDVSTNSDSLNVQCPDGTMVVLPQFSNSVNIHNESYK